MGTQRKYGVEIGTPRRITEPLYRSTQALCARLSQQPEVGDEFGLLRELRRRRLRAVEVGKATKARRTVAR